jgi:hypothetical protein
VTLLLGITQALDLSKTRAMEMAHGAHTTELESDNAKLRSELEQAHPVLAKADVTQSLLSTDWERLERECAGLHTAVHTLKEEKIQVMSDREAAVAAEQKKFQDCHIGHRVLMTPSYVLKKRLRRYWTQLHK